MDFNYDVIVIGAGHAGCEAAAASANLGSKTCLITMDMNKIAQMSCNPAVGGIAKGQIVREIDALGGYMGIVTDRTAIQFRMLNRSKGPAMWSPRAQCDRAKFIWTWREILENIPNLHIWQDTVEELLVEDGEVKGVVTCWGVTFHARCVILTAGTFLNGLMHIGRKMLAGGRCAEPASYHLTESITRHGITAGRMKTGTPVRIDARSVDFSLMETQDGENDFHSFSFMSEPRHLKQLQCWTCYTNEEVHAVLRSGLADSPLYNGQIQSIGPRYCPSIETKIVTFPVFFAEKINPKTSASVPSETDTICVSILIRYSPIISPSHLPNTGNRSCLLIFATPSALSSMNCPTNTPYSTTEHFAEPLPPTICIFREFRRSTFH